MGTDIELARELIEELYELGAIHQDSWSALRAGTAPKEIGAGLRYDEATRDILLATILVDDSGSIAEHMQAVRRGHERLLGTLARQQSRTTEVRVLTRTLNKGALSPFLPIQSATALDAKNYNPLDLGGTPLYRQSQLTLATVAAMARRYERDQVNVRTFTILMTDGENFPVQSDVEAQKVSVGHVKTMVDDMLVFATNHIVAGLGVGERGFTSIFRQMGIPDRLIFTSGSSDAEFDAIFAAIGDMLAIAASSRARFAGLLNAGPSPTQT